MYGHTITHRPETTATHARAPTPDLWLARRPRRGVRLSSLRLQPTRNGQERGEGEKQNRSSHCRHLSIRTRGRQLCCGPAGSGLIISSASSSSTIGSLGSRLPGRFGWSGASGCSTMGTSSTSNSTAGSKEGGQEGARRERKRSSYQCQPSRRHISRTTRRCVLESSRTSGSASGSIAGSRSRSAPHGARGQGGA
jgi:hypothetical protein